MRAEGSKRKRSQKPPGEVGFRDLYDICSQPNKNLQEAGALIRDTGKTCALVTPPHLMLPTKSLERLAQPDEPYLTLSSPEPSA